MQQCVKILQYNMFNNSDYTYYVVDAHKLLALSPF